MPRQRTGGKQRSALHLSDLRPVEWLSLRLGWSPPADDLDRSRTRWETWSDFLGDYGAIRAEYAAELGDFPAFGEWLYAETGGDPARVAAIAARGDALTAAERARYPALITGGVGAVWRAARA